MTETKLTKVSDGTCYCGCGQTTGTRSLYRPGHDARHVSNLLAAAVSDGLSTGATKMLALQLPSDALKDKFFRAVDRYAERQSRKRSNTGRARAANWVDCDTDEYRIGRWTYPVQVLARENSTGGTEYTDFRRNTKRDGSGEWVALGGGELVGR